ncbi:MAG: PAS domain-containing protein, partial [Haloferacaceae archaeon]
MTPPSETPSPSDYEDASHVHLVLDPGERRRRIAEWLDREYEVTTSTTLTPSVEADLCLVDEVTRPQNRDAIERFRDDSVFAPVLYLAAGPTDSVSPSIRESVDDVLRAPIDRTELLIRVENLLERRRTARRLADTERELDATETTLCRTQRAIDAAPIGVTITDPAQPDNPVVYHNAAFEELTGYTGEEVRG